VMTGSLLQIADMSVQAMMNPTATRSDVGGSEGLTWGGVVTPVFRSFAIIWPEEGVANKWQVFHIYKGFNDSGLAAQITKSKLGASPFAIRGYEITTRTQGDRLARFFYQVSGAS
jgi:hypothetical protein